MRLALGVVLAGLAAACSSTPDIPGTPLSDDELRDPQKCQQCHPDHYREWSGSMHAYAADDPVFRAMNARGQRETNHMLGTFCVKCHAPMAVRNGATTDGLNLDSLAQKDKGVTCYFCHSASAVKDTHDAPIDLATDQTFRAGISDPVPNQAHKAGFSSLLSRDSPDSATLCGSCHDIVTSGGAHIERTFAEWKDTLFSRPPIELTCGQCHMDGRMALAAQAPNVALRKVHAHDFPAVDLALTAFPEADTQKAKVQKLLDTTLQAALCVTGGAQDGIARVQVVLDNVAAGHKWPSGATQDRRAWVELKAYKQGAIVYQSGVVDPGGDVTKLMDPDLWLVRDCMFDGQGKEVSMFWQAVTTDPNELPGPITSDQSDPNFYITHVARLFPRKASPALMTAPDRVTMRVLFTPIGADVLADLVTSKDLDAKVAGSMTTFTLATTELEWTPATAKIKYPEQGLETSCVAVGLSGGGQSANPAPEHMKCAP